MAQLWKVVSGAEHGGVLVRKECGLTSDTEGARLAPDAVVKELGFHDGRLHYQLISGRGPATGWVTINLRGKDLLLKEGTQEKPVRKARSGPFSQWMNTTPTAKAEQTSETSTFIVTEEQKHAEDSASVNSEISTISGETTGEVSKEQAEESKNIVHEITSIASKAEDSRSISSEISTITREKAEAKDVLRRYAEKFGEAIDCRKEGYSQRESSGYVPQLREKKTPVEAFQAALIFKRSKMCHNRPQLRDSDSNDEPIPLCPVCILPIGENSYECLGASVHGECMAQVLARTGQKTEVRVRQMQNSEKMKSRLQYDIGWRMESVPKNSIIAARLGCSSLPQGMCCLVYDEAAQTVQIAATHEPAASINLEYLMLALKVRKYRNREPLFSLDPVDAKNMATTLQRKVYEPDWLAGTSVGDVMFQADYFLKELALGEYDMPVAGMQSVLDMSCHDRSNKEWAAREWFMVRKAEVRMAKDKTLVPHVKMGVEAREQVLGSKGLEDKPVTLPNHPCKKFADSFTRNFDLIAERKSVVYHLRELAKASVLAKFLVDSGARVEQSWYDAADAIIRSTKPEAHRQIPSLWNMRGESRIQLKEGRLVNTATGLTAGLQAVYGGVNFGLDKLELQQRSVQPSLAPPMQGQPARTRGLAPDMMGTPAMPAGQGQTGMRPLQGQPPTARTGMRMEAGQPGVQPAVQKLQMDHRQPTVQRIAMDLRQPAFKPERFVIGVARDETPQGVDLNLDKFNLMEPDRMNNILPACSATLDSVEGRVSLGQIFLQNFQQSACSGLKEEHKQLLKRILNPAICDRTEEGAAFVPPEPHLEYISRVRNLVSEESRILENRKAGFFAKDFVADSPGPEFPCTWTSQCQVAKEGRTPSRIAANQDRLMTIDVDAEFQKFLLSEVLPGVTPDFDKTTEDGVVFRIYSVGRLQIRTTEAQLGEEVVGAVFSHQTPCWQPSPGKIAKTVREGERVVKAKVYIEALETDLAQPQIACGRFYVVLETEASNIVVTEKLADGSGTWVLNADNLEERNSLAKLLFTTERKGATLQSIRSLQAKHSKPSSASEVPAASQAYAEAIFQLISGHGFHGRWGSTEAAIPAFAASAVRSPAPMNLHARRTPPSSTASKKKTTTVSPDFSRVKMEIF
eukprot:TRINITY_DN354_c1_g1_i1.p1 TRINITY_DN354_c1_g1~~TRINITY_DN354_c1_g1_i1.p1  ORF type:complete len:1142 (+),score=241.95 TRINITY_DN354_c1_g1_i1:94-3519(+)